MKKVLCVLALFILVLGGCPNAPVSPAGGKIVVQFDLSETMVKLAAEKGGGGYLDYPPLDPATISVIAEMLKREVTWVTISLSPYYSGEFRQKDFAIDPNAPNTLTMEEVTPGEYFVSVDCGVDHAGYKFYAFWGGTEAEVASGMTTSCPVFLDSRGYQTLFKVKGCPFAAINVQLMFNGYILNTFSIGSELLCSAWLPFGFNSDVLVVTGTDGVQRSMDVEFNYFDVKAAVDYTPVLNWPNPGQLVVNPEFVFPLPASLDVILNSTEAKVSFQYGDQVPEKLFGYLPESVGIYAVYEYEALLYAFDGPDSSIAIPRPLAIHLVARPKVDAKWEFSNPEQWLCLVDGEVRLPDIEYGWTLPPTT